MSTAIEIEMRMAEARKRMEPLHEGMRVLTHSLFNKVYDMKVPLIKYGRQKRRWRRMFTPLPNVKIEL